MENEGSKKKEFPAESVTDIEEVRKLIQVRPEYKEYEEEILRIIVKSGALLKGHFRLGPDED